MAPFNFRTPFSYQSHSFRTPIFVPPKIILKDQGTETVSDLVAWIPIGTRLWYSRECMNTSVARPGIRASSDLLQFSHTILTPFA